MSPRALISWLLNCRKCGNCLRTVALSLLPAMLGLTLAAAPSNIGTFKDFTSVDTDPKGAKTILKGASGRQTAQGEIAITELRIEVYRPGNQLDMIVLAPECLFDPERKTAHSTGPLTVETADGRFGIRGRGFQWQQDTSQLVIHNDVETTILKNFLNSTTNTLTRPIPPASAGARGATNSPLHILSNRFEHRADVATFEGNVRATDPDGTLRCGILRAYFSQKDRRLARIEAFQDVVIEQLKGRAQGSKASYNVSDETVLLEDGVVWTFEDKQGSSDRLSLNRSKESLRAYGHVALTLPSQSLLPPDALGDPGQPRAQAPPTATNEVVRIFADEFSFEPGRAAFREQVRALSAGTELHCDELLLFSSRTNRSPERVVARGHMKIVQGANWATSDEAVYVTADDTLTLMGQPNWLIGDKPGRSDSLVLHPKSKRFVASGHAELTLPFSATNAASFGLPGSSSAKPAELASTNRLVHVSSRTIRQEPGHTFFVDEVRVQDEQGPFLTCQFLSVFYDALNKPDQIIAVDEVRLQDGDRVAEGGQAIYHVQRGQIELNGEPRLISPERTVRAEKILVNRADGTLHIIGNYRIEVRRTAFKTSPVPR